MITPHSLEESPYSRIEVYTLRSDFIELSAINYGGIIVSLRVPDRSGEWQDVILRYDAVEQYFCNPAYLGAIVGRYANRIANGRFRLDGKDHQLAKNEGTRHLHGGVHGFDQQMWRGAHDTSSGTPAIRFSRVSEDGEEGYPGALDVTVTYRLTAANKITIEYEALTDAPSVINLTQHTYFNLGGTAAPTIDDHELTLHADAFIPVDRHLIPTGALADVAGTPFDFRVRAKIGERLAVPDRQLELAGGFDHNWVLSDRAGELKPAAVLRHPGSGRALTIATTEPGVQFYDGHMLDRAEGANDAKRFAPRAGLCLETQHFPDSPNQPAFPSTVIRPGISFRSMTTWQFSCF